MESYLWPMLSRIERVEALWTLLCILSDEAVFLHSKDVIAGKHNGNDVIKDVERDHVMQVTMNNIWIAHQTICQLLKRSNIIFTGWVAQAIKLMLANIGKIKHIQGDITMEKSVMIYIYNHTKYHSLHCYTLRYYICFLFLFLLYFFNIKGGKKTPRVLLIEINETTIVIYCHSWQHIW